MKNKKWMKGVAIAAIAAMSVGMLAGCGSSDAQQEEQTYKVGVVQLMQHGALDQANQGMIDGLKDNGFEEGKQIDVNAANQELQGIMDVSNSITSSEYNSTKNSLNTAIGRIRTFLGDQTADHYNDMIESYNSFIGSVNRLDMNKLDK